MSTPSTFTCRVLDFFQDRQAIGEFRYGVFAKGLRWVPGDPATGLELDDLDPQATHIGAFDGAGRLVGYVRVICGGASCGMLLQKPAFAKLIPHDLDTSARTAEISRLCVRLAAIAKLQLDELLVELYRAIYRFVVVPSQADQQPVELLYATSNNRNAGYMNAERLWRIGFTTLAGPVRLSASSVETQLLGLDLSTAFRNPQFREMLGI